ncbi:hypothetical protein L9F63_024533, partial [Diploptera punctata]
MSSMVTLWIWAAVISLILLVAYLIGTWNHDYFTKRNTPCLKTVPFLGNSSPVFFREITFSQHILNIYVKLRGYKFGGIFEFMKPVLFLRDPKLIKLVTIKDFEYFTDHQFQYDEDLEPLINKSLFNLQGQKWKETRANFCHAFTSKNMKNMFKLSTKCADQLLDFLMQYWEGRLPVEIEDLLTEYINNIIVTSVLGNELASSKNTNEVYEMMKKMTDSSESLVVIFSIQSGFPIKILKMFKIILTTERINKFLKCLDKNILVADKKSSIYPDIIHLLMQTKKIKLQNKKSSSINGKIIMSEWADKELGAQVLLFLFYGFNKVSILLSFVSYQLALHPDIQINLQQEIDNNLKENGNKLTYEALHNMKYLNMVILETLRLYPSKIYTDRRLYYLDPDKFDPERFNEENKDKIKSFTYMPFGLGPRMCI